MPLPCRPRPAPPSSIPDSLTFVRRHRIALGLLAGVLLALVRAAFAPITVRDHEMLFEIPQGAWQRRMAGERNEPLPSVIHLTLGAAAIIFRHGAL